MLKCKNIKHTILIQEMDGASMEMDEVSMGMDEFSMDDVRISNGLSF